MVVLYIVIGLVVILGLYWLLERNSMVGARNRVDEAWSGIDVQLKRRRDLGRLHGPPVIRDHRRGRARAGPGQLQRADLRHRPGELGRGEGPGAREGAGRPPAGCGGGHPAQPPSRGGRTPGLVAFFPVCGKKATTTPRIGGWRPSPAASTRC